MKDIKNLRENHRRNQERSRNQKDSTINGFIKTKTDTQEKYTRELSLEMERLNGEITRTGKEYTQESASQENQYRKRIIDYVLGGLTEDYDFLNRASPLSKEYSPQEIAQSEEVYRVLSNLPKSADEAKELILKGTSEKVKEILEYKAHEQETLGERDITSYIGCNENSCYLIPPVKSNEPILKGLVKMLDKQISESLTLDGITLSISPKINRERQVLDAGTKKIIFTTEIDETKSGFILYEMTPEKEEENKNLMQSLKDRFESEELAIKYFKEHGINHKIEILHNREFIYVMNNGIYVSSEIAEQYQPTEQIEVQSSPKQIKPQSPKPIKVQSLKPTVNKSVEPASKKLESLAKLAQCTEEELTTSQVRDILGYVKGNAVNVLIKNKAISSRQNENNRHLIPKKDIDNFIRTSKVNPSGRWIPGN